MFKTKMTELLGIKYPIQCGTMGLKITGAQLTAAVANAGGLCCICGSMYYPKQEFIDEIKRAQDMTDKPFGVNVSLFPEMTVTVTPEERIDWVIESGVRILETSGRNPEPYRKQITDARLIHIHKCARVRDTIKVDKMGVDIVSLVGTECGGHPSMEEISTLVLIPAAIDQISKPLIAGGGFCDGRGLVAALALGATGINMGTRFMATKECPIPESVKQRLIEAAETETLLVMKSLMNPSRVLRTSTSEKILELEAKGTALEELAPYISGRTSEAGWMAGDIEKGMMACGQVVGRIHDIPTVKELMERIMADALEAKEYITQL
jgi:nitronate monooxygenase